MIDRSRSLTVNRLSLSQVTLCAVTSVNVTATVRALEACLEQISFAGCKLFTDASVEDAHPDIRIVPISRLGSAAAYSDFMLSQLADHIETSHSLIAQWDGHLLDARHWLPEFLDYDYIGASWPQFSNGQDVGNGGFSLRSLRLMEACRKPEFHRIHPEDLAIGRTNRDWLESMGMRFAPRELADVFAAERSGDPQASFGYHGVFNMPRAIGIDAFWEIYLKLDDRSSVRHDFATILQHVAQGPQAPRRSIRMLTDRVRDSLSGIR